MKYSMTDRKVERPTCTMISVLRLDDSDPDLSWLDQTDDEMGEGFEAQAAERKASYGDDWEMIGIRATAQVLIPMGGASNMQTIESPGLWGVESDSTDEYLHQIEDEQLDELRGILDALGIDHSNATIYR